MCHLGLLCYYLSSKKYPGHLRKVWNIGLLNPKESVKRILRFFTRQINPRSLGTWCVKGTEESNCGSVYHYAIFLLHAVMSRLVPLYLNFGGPPTNLARMAYFPAQVFIASVLYFYSKPFLQLARAKQLHIYLKNSFLFSKME